MGPRDDLARDESPVTSGAFENCSPDFDLGAYQNKSGSRRHLVLEIWIESQSVNQGVHAVSASYTHGRPRIPTFRPLQDLLGIPSRGQARLRLERGHGIRICTLLRTEEFILVPDEPWPGCFRSPIPSLAC
jgi:hypothetical protein